MVEGAEDESIRSEQEKLEDVRDANAIMLKVGDGIEALAQHLVSKSRCIASLKDANEEKTAQISALKAANEEKTAQISAMQQRITSLEETVQRVLASRFTE